MPLGKGSPLERGVETEAPPLKDVILLGCPA